MRQFLSIFCGALIAVASVTSLSAKQAAPAAPAAPTYDVVFDVQGNQYVGTTSFAVDKAGKVSGTMKLTDPALVNAKLNGEVANGVWKFAYPFTMDNEGQPCEGTVSGTAKLTADQSEAAGDVNISGTCSADALVGTFKITKKK
jgi:hypothetical protein